MSEIKYVYPYSRNEAIKCNQKDMWQESHKWNCDCARNIERAIADAYDYNEKCLNECAKPIIEKYGYNRTMYVLANTIKEKDFDGRIAAEHKNWAKGIYVPRDENNWQFVVDSHSGLVNLFVGQVLSEYKNLGLFDAHHCESEKHGEIDYTDKLLVLKASVLKDEYTSPDYQLFFAKGGFGCKPDSRGQKVYGCFLKDGEETYFYRSDFYGAIKDEHIPEWAKMKLNELSESELTETEGICME